MSTDTKTLREKLDAGENISFQIHPDARFALLAARASGMLGDRAYKQIFDLDPTDLGMLIAFLEDLKLCKERETPAQKKARGA
jgi:mannose-6-phosphate isomerase class I